MDALYEEELAEEQAPLLEGEEDQEITQLDAWVVIRSVLGSAPGLFEPAELID